MSGLENIVKLIRADAVRECSEISDKSSKECALILAEYSKEEQTEYWKLINDGTKVAEQRLESLSNLAVTESRKQVATMQQEIANEVFELAAKKLSDLTSDEFSILLRKLSLPPDTCARDIVLKYKDKLNSKVITILFD